jgi:ATP-dependent Clp protease ATP-binding subunit ClpC
VEQRLAKRVVGQAEAVASVARALRRAAAGLAGGRGPLARLLFVGPTGTGKTELARALAEELGGHRHLVRIDCSEFGGRHETSKLLGAPPGFVGHEHGGLLARRLTRMGACVLLFDEVEKAHPHLHELLLQALDEGRLTGGRGEFLDLSQAFVILTSNAGTRELSAARERLGFARAGLAEDAARGIVERALGAAFAPEFLARLDEIVLFRELEPARLRQVASRALLDLALRVRANRKHVCFTAAVARWAAERGRSAACGARGVLHCIRREIEAPLAEALLSAEDGTWIEVAIRRGRPRFALAA